MKPLKEWREKELRIAAREAGFTGISRLRKEELYNLIFVDHHQPQAPAKLTLWQKAKKQWRYLAPITVGLLIYAAAPSKAPIAAGLTIGGLIVLSSTNKS